MRAPRNQNADTHAGVFPYFHHTRTSSQMRTHTHTHAPFCVSPQIKTKHGDDERLGHEVTASSSPKTDILRLFYFLQSFFDIS